MPFRGLTMLKSLKLIIKVGLCYGFAMVVGLQPTPPLVTRPVSAVLGIAKLFSFPSLAILVSLHY